ncbi:DoxX family protein [uncultured Tenacibaculum sp.]|uniref:DoxX family protein n=1 Tax=uncultured Tenacibaculum sp. TaxID=174713 RepID=UPI0026275242|nr:DoxX family protein [uncultured Tenacibaculum sp.]
MNILYWISTVLISGFLLLSSYTYIFSSTTIEGIKSLGFPDFFRIQKTIAAFVLIIPNLPILLKEWSYVGTGLFLITAFVAHIAHRDSIFISLLLLILFLVLALSYMTFHKIFYI